jgi:hypothetical protein
MSKPEIRVGVGIYDLAWADEQIAIRIDRLYQNGHSSLSGEILVKTLLPAMPSHLHQARLNLTSTSARRTLANHLEERLPEIDWGAIVEQACVLVLRAYREGEPVVALQDVAPRQGPRFRLDPLILEGHPTLIFGPSGVGKSLLALYFGVLISSGHHHQGLSPMPGNCLYLDYEASPEEQHERVMAIETGLGESGFSNILYRYSHQPLASDIEEIQRIVSENEIEFAIVDSMGFACGGDPNSPEAILAYFAALRSLRITTLTLDHVAKNAITPTPFGSVYKTNLSRSVFELRREQEPGEDTMQMGLFHRKANFGSLLPPMGLAATIIVDPVTKKPVTITFAPCSLRDIPALAEGMSVRERIKNLLPSSGPLTAKQIAEELDIPQTSVRSALNRFKGRNFTRLTGGPEPTWAALTEAKE